MEGALGLDAQKLVARVALPKDLDLLGSERLNHEAIFQETRSCCPEASSAGPKAHGARIQTSHRARLRRPPTPAGGATPLSSRVAWVLQAPLSWWRC